MRTIQRFGYILRNRTTGWENLRSLEKIKVINSMYIWIFIVPVLAKSTQAINGIVALTIFEYTFKFDFGLPFSWYLFYFSALLFVLGNILVIFFCPSLIKDGITRRSLEEKAAPFVIVRDYAIELGLNPDSDYNYGSIEELYVIANCRYFPIRLVTSVIYAAGLVLIAYVLYENFLVVVRILCL